MDEHREGKHLLAAWARSPLACTASVILLGGVLLALSLAVPLGLPFLAFATVGTIAVVSGTLTAIVLVVGRLLGLRRRSDAAVAQGRQRMLFPGTKAPVMHLSSVGSPAHANTGQVAAQQSAVNPDAGASSQLVVDLRSSDRQSSAA